MSGMDIRDIMKSVSLLKDTEYYILSALYENENGLSVAEIFKYLIKNDRYVNEQTIRRKLSSLIERGVVVKDEQHLQGAIKSVRYRLTDGGKRLFEALSKFATE